MGGNERTLILSELLGLGVGSSLPIDDVTSSDKGLSDWEPDETGSTRGKDVSSGNLGCEGCQTNPRTITFMLFECKACLFRVDIALSLNDPGFISAGVGQINPWRTPRWWVGPP